MNRIRISKLLSALPEGKIGVTGDFCTDVYWDIEPEKGEISLETGILTTPVGKARYSLGGAGNIVANLRGLGMKNIPCCGAAGSDPFGSWMFQQLTGENPGNTAAMFTIGRPDYHTPVYCKPLLNGREKSRIDLGNTPLTAAESARMLDALEELLPSLKVLIVNEQIANGIHNEYFRCRFARMVSKYCEHIRFVFDGRAHLDAYPGVTLKINASAASFLAFGESGHTPEESGTEILRRSPDELVITDGENGCFVFERSGTTHIPAVTYSGEVDTVGAGDSFTAGFSCALASGASLTDSAMLGTLCSSVTIRMLNQTGVPSPEKIMEIIS